MRCLVMGEDDVYTAVCRVCGVVSDVQIWETGVGVGGTRLGWSPRAGMVREVCGVSVGG